MRRICARVDKRKTARPFFAFRLTRTNPSSAQDFFAYSIKEKRVKRFSTPDFINQIRAVRRNRARVDKRKTARLFSPFDLQSKFEQWSFAVHPCTAHYRIFATQKYASVLRRCDTASVPCIEGVLRATCNKREARSSPRRICSRLLSHAATQALHRVSS